MIYEIRDMLYTNSAIVSLTASKKFRRTSRYFLQYKCTAKIAVICKISQLWKRSLLIYKNIADF